MDAFLGVTVTLALLTGIVALGCMKMRGEESRRAQDVAAVAGVNAREAFTAEDNFHFWTRVMWIATIAFFVFSTAATIGFLLIFS